MGRHRPGSDRTSPLTRVREDKGRPIDAAEDMSCSYPKNSVLPR
jgi:hypothetical protein